MSNEANECFCSSGMLVNQLVTSDVFFHWLSFVIFLIFELILSRTCLLTFPSSLFAGFMRRHVGWLVKLSLWSFKVIKATAPAYSNKSKWCHLCLTEKLYLIRAKKPSLLNKRTELISKCRPENKFYLANFTSRQQ